MENISEIKELDPHAELEISRLILYALQNLAYEKNLLMIDLIEYCQYRNPSLEEEDIRIAAFNMPLHLGWEPFVYEKLPDNLAAVRFEKTNLKL
jgi:hypothetical protein